MDHEFWHNAWAKSEQPGWQQTEANSALVAHWRASRSTVFVPLCGRSPDLQWLHKQGHQVVGIDLSEAAIRRFFEDRSIAFAVDVVDGFKVYRADGYTLYAGDYFSLTAGHLSEVRDVYDRAALVAMPESMRGGYARHLQHIIPGGATVFMVLIDYDQSLMKGPPFSVPESQVRHYYSERYNIEILQRDTSHMKRRGLDHLVETTYRLTPQKA